MRKILLSIAAILAILASVFLYSPGASLTESQEKAMREACVSEAEAQWGRWDMNTITGNSDLDSVKHKNGDVWTGYVSVGYTTPNYDVEFHYTRLCEVSIDGEKITRITLK